MSANETSDHNIDNLLKQVLKDDLPSETERGMRKHLTAFRHALESLEDLHARPSRGRHERLLWAAQWHVWHGVLRKEVLACLSVAMLTAGVVIHLGGHQNLLANSISLLKRSMSLTEQLRLARSMECVITMQTAGTQATTYRIRWARDGGTRVDVESPHGVDATWWVIQGRLAAAGPAVKRSSPAADPALNLPEPTIALQSPVDLARRLEASWQLQSERDRRNPDKLIFSDRQSGAVIEVYFDGKSFLPVRISRKPAEANGKAGIGGAAMIAEFIWDRPMAPDLLVPRLEPGR